MSNKNIHMMTTRSKSIKEENINKDDSSSDSVDDNGNLKDFIDYDEDIKRIKNKSTDFKKIIAKNIMKKNPISIDKDTLASKSLAIMSDKKITCLCVHSKKNNMKTIGILQIHSILNSNIQ